MEPSITEILNVKMIKGTHAGLNDDHSILISDETAKILFGGADPMGQVIKIDNDQSVKVTGVYENFPYNSDFGIMQFIGSWKLYLDNMHWTFKESDPWRANMFRAFVQVNDQADMQKVSAKIKDSKLQHVNKRELEFKSRVFLHPMSQMAFV